MIFDDSLIEKVKNRTKQYYRRNIKLADFFKILLLFKKLIKIFTPIIHMYFSNM